MHTHHACIRRQLHNQISYSSRRLLPSFQDNAEQLRAPPMPLGGLYGQRHWVRVADVMAAPLLRGQVCAREAKLALRAARSAPAVGLNAAAAAAGVSQATARAAAVDTMRRGSAAERARDRVPQRGAGGASRGDQPSGDPAAGGVAGSEGTFLAGQQRRFG